MTAAEYLEQRVDQQIAWYSRSSIAAQKSFKCIRFVEILCAALIPFIAGFGANAFAAQVAVGVLGAVIVVLTALLGLGKYQENWLEYRTTAEALKQEKYLFLARAEPYEADTSFPQFVHRIESLLAKENNVWSQHTRVQGKPPTTN